MAPALVLVLLSSILAVNVHSADANCKKDEKYYGCKPVCNNTCENFGRKGPCPDYCMSGCFCKPGLVLKKDGECVKPEKCKKECPLVNCLRGCPLDRNNKPCPTCACPDKTCLLPKEVGPCRAKFRRWYYDVEQTKCQLFFYGGCKGNKNNFESFEECNKTCEVKLTETCGQNEVFSECVNPCNDCYTRGKCEFLVCNKGCDCRKGYRRNDQGVCIPERWCPAGSCGKNEEYKDCGTACEPTCAKKNQVCTQQCKSGCFCKRGSIREKEGCGCIRKSQCPSEICLQPKKVGHCYGYFRRWYYNVDQSKCQRFIYGGCEGNKNNFESFEECNKKCKVKLTENTVNNSEKDETEPLSGQEDEDAEEDESDDSYTEDDNMEEDEDENVGEETDSD